MIVVTQREPVDFPFNLDGSAFGWSMVDNGRIP